MKNMSKKMIKIPSSGPIRARSFIAGPILTPYKEDVRTIGAMINDGVTVIEVLDNGTELPLTLVNFNKDNNPKEVVAEEVKTAPAAQVQTQQPQKQAQQQHQNQNKNQQQQQNKSQQTAPATDAAKAEVKADEVTEK